MVLFRWSGFVSVVWFCFSGMILFQWNDFVSVVWFCFSGIIFAQWSAFVLRGMIGFSVAGFVFSVVGFAFSVVCFMSQWFWFFVASAALACRSSAMAAARGADLKDDAQPALVARFSRCARRRRLVLSVPSLSASTPSATMKKSPLFWGTKGICHPLSWWFTRWNILQFF